MATLSRAVVAVLAVAALVLAGCGSTSPDVAAGPQAPSAMSEPTGPAAVPTPRPETRPAALRQGESFRRLVMPTAYTPSAPTPGGTDDYHCFLLNPKLAQDMYLTGFDMLPGNRDVVHHMILFRVQPSDLRAARKLDAQQPGDGWTCFGSVTFGTGPQLNDAPWLGAWAPGGKEAVDAPGFGTRLAKGSWMVLQVHYNLLAGDSPDRSGVQLRLHPVTDAITPLQTMLLPAPVELPCRKGHQQNPLCNRQASMNDVIKRFGNVGYTNNLLYYLCGGTPHPSEVTSCVRTIAQPTTIRAVAGHMHLLGRSIKIVVNPGTPRAKTVLDIPIWNFDNQGSKPIKPVHLQPFDKVQVTCKHVQWLRDRLPAFQGQPDRYVVWGEGTTDEMCLGILTVTVP